MKKEERFKKKFSDSLNRKEKMGLVYPRAMDNLPQVTGGMLPMQDRKEYEDIHFLFRQVTC
jgi:hypothetical protein